jgi:hypothetical protein
MTSPLACCQATNHCNADPRAGPLRFRSSAEAPRGRVGLRASLLLLVKAKRRKEIIRALASSPAARRTTERCSARRVPKHSLAPMHPWNPGHSERGCSAVEISKPSLWLLRQHRPSSCSSRLGCCPVSVVGPRERQNLFPLPIASLKGARRSLERGANVPEPTPEISHPAREGFSQVNQRLCFALTVNARCARRYDGREEERAYGINSSTHRHRRRSFLESKPPYPPAPGWVGIECELSPAPRFEAANYRPAGKLDGKVAVITGADSVIGRAVAVLSARGGDAVIDLSA